MKRSVPHAFVTREQVADLTTAFTNELDSVNSWLKIDWRLQVTPERTRLVMWLIGDPDASKVAVDIATEDFFLAVGYEKQLARRTVDKLVADLGREPRR